MAQFLFEAGFEEIPARMIAGAEAELARRVTDLLSREHLLAEGHSVVGYSTPRRLAVKVDGVIASQADREEQLTGPAAKIAYKDGQPTPAAHAFAKKAGVDVDALTTVTTPKGDYVSVLVSIKGKSASALLVEQMPLELTQIYWAKSMYWRAGKPERLVRPLQWMLALLDDAVVPVEFAGVTAGSVTYGHRVLCGEAPVPISQPAQYLKSLEGAFVLADAAARRQRIRKALDAATRAAVGMRWREDEPLVETVTHLTEWPSAVLGKVEAEYLTLPEEILVTVMRDHQKYFAVEDADHKIAPYFLTVLNTEVDARGLATIEHGNARVLRARFNDARFFWNHDQKISLVDRVQLLKNVTFQKDLGSYYEKTEANEIVAEAFASLAIDKGTNVDLAALMTAVRLAKADLTSELVKEFTELQGIVGGLYASAQGHGELVARAIYTQYQPASMEDAIPSTIEGQLLGLADRMRTIVAMFAIGLEPTGSKDPFALRRAGNAVIKILADSGLPLTLTQLVVNSLRMPDESKANDATVIVSSFLRERLDSYLREARGFRYDVVSAVLAKNTDDVPDAIARSIALTEMRGSEDFVAVSSAFKRIENILRQAKKDSIEISNIVDPSVFHEEEESRLHSRMQELLPLVSKLESVRNYRDALQTIATLRPIIDAFFDKVMVMAPDEKVRKNRLALIAQVPEGFSRIGDLSEIVTG